jgi:cellobiose phosphorylase
VTYRIAMKRTGERTVSVDGKLLDGDIAPVPSDGAKPVEVAVTF